MNCVATRYPWLIDPAKHDFTKHKTGRVKKVDGVFSYLSFGDAAELIAAILGAPLPGFRIYMPAHPKNRLGRAAADLVREYYPGIPLRRPLEEIESSVDISRIQNETGWVTGRSGQHARLSYSADTVWRHRELRAAVGPAWRERSVCVREDAQSNVPVL
jgi:nucleoside-diphosphate-sugar epimerase